MSLSCIMGCVLQRLYFVFSNFIFDRINKFKLHICTFAGFLGRALDTPFL